MSIKTVTHFYANETIAQRESDGYVSLTNMAKAAGKKKISHYLENANTKAYIAALATDTGIPASQLIIVNKGNFSDIAQGTWAHPEVAMHFAQWASIGNEPQAQLWEQKALSQTK